MRLNALCPQTSSFLDLDYKQLNNTCDKMSSSEQSFLVALRNKFESKKTRNIYPREQYNELLAKIKLLESSEKKSTTDYYNLKRHDIFIIKCYERLITKQLQCQYLRLIEGRAIVEIYQEELLRYLIQPFFYDRYSFIKF